MRAYFSPAVWHLSVVVAVSEAALDRQHRSDAVLERERIQEEGDEEHEDMQAVHQTYVGAETLVVECDRAVAVVVHMNIVGEVVELARGSIVASSENHVPYWFASNHIRLVAASA